MLRGTEISKGSNEWHTEDPIKEERSNLTTEQHLVSESVHDDGVGHQAQRVDLPHEHVGGDLVKLDVLQEVADDLL